MWFHVSGFGDCRATTGPTHRPPVTHRPAGRQPGPTVTVTVTRTVWCQDDPACRPVEGKWGGRHVRCDVREGTEGMSDGEWAVRRN